MSKTKDTSTPATLDDHGTLADSELDTVSGATATQSNDALTQVLQQLLQSIQSQSKTGTTG